MFLHEYISRTYNQKNPSKLTKKLIEEFANSVYEMMKFFNLNEELSLIDKIQNYLNNFSKKLDFLPIPDIIPAILNPINLSYNDILRLSGYKLYLQLFSMEKFEENAAFLLGFDIEELQEINEHFINSWLLKLIDHKNSKQIASEIKKLLSKYYSHYERVQKILKILSSSSNDKTVYLKKLLSLQITLLNHEEQRHYWQMRSLRNFYRLFKLFNLPTLDSNLSDLLKKLK
ncbi:MAG: hypothetical protein PWQ83_231 [Thermosipho sp. (in: thermotogales)]|nr:hypothetical protein [Thermosipho sp. (in: thermotogales)]